MSNISKKHLESPSTQIANLIITHKEYILHEWIDRAQSSLPKLKGVRRDQVADQLTHLLGDLVDSLLNYQESPGATTLSAGDSGLAHGRERVSIKDLTADDLVHEFILLRKVIMNLCYQNGHEDAVSAEIIMEVIELSALSSVKEFVRGIEEVQHKIMSTLAHDLRTPLGVASNYVEILLLGDFKKEQKNKMLKTVTKGLARSLSMLEEMLDLERLRAGSGIIMRFEETDLLEIIKDTCAEASMLYHREITSKLAVHPVVGVFDVSSITRTVENLISNAIKFGSLDEPITVMLEDNEDFALIKVHNCGSPIPEDVAGDIFKFFVTNPKDLMTPKKGWGLGLALVKLVAGCHGGEVILESSAEEGTTFGIKLGKKYREEGEESTELLERVAMQESVS